MTQIHHLGEPAQHQAASKGLFGSSKSLGQLKAGGALQIGQHHTEGRLTAEA